MSLSVSPTVKDTEVCLPDADMTPAGGSYILAIT